MHEKEGTEERKQKRHYRKKWKLETLGVDEEEKEKKVVRRRASQ
jgi:hypothetical protein